MNIATLDALEGIVLFAFTECGGMDVCSEKAYRSEDSAVEGCLIWRLGWLNCESHTGSYAECLFLSRLVEPLLR